ncbi:hypothetical protein [Micromonospora arida]
MTVTGPVLAVAVGILAAMFVASGVPKLRRPFDSTLAMVRECSNGFGRSPDERSA